MPLTEPDPKATFMVAGQRMGSRLEADIDLITRAASVRSLSQRGGVSVCLRRVAGAKRVGSHAHPDGKVMNTGEGERVERRLTAILAADVVGYSRLMGADEEGTLRRLNAHRGQLVDPKISEHRGRIVKTTGDGLLVEFPSVVNAVRCATEIQRAMVDRNSEMAEDRRIIFRVGINLGDVIVEDDDIFGDGVNIAARLEALADPGGICISGTVYDHIGDRLPYAFEDMGQQSVKNIARPVRAFCHERHHRGRDPASPCRHPPTRTGPG
jgi:class 3 adenylate cyclase